MTSQHGTIVGMALMSIAVQMSNPQLTWHAVLTPQFISGAILAVGSTIAGIKSQPPQGKP